MDINHLFQIVNGVLNSARRNNRDLDAYVTASGKINVTDGYIVGSIVLPKGAEDQIIIIDRYTTWFGNERPYQPLLQRIGQEIENAGLKVEYQMAQ